MKKPIMTSSTAVFEVVLRVEITRQPEQPDHYDDPQLAIDIAQQIMRGVGVDAVAEAARSALVDTIGTSHTSSTARVTDKRFVGLRAMYEPPKVTP